MFREHGTPAFRGRFAMYFGRPLYPQLTSSTPCARNNPELQVTFSAGSEIARGDVRVDRKIVAPFGHCGYGSRNRRKSIVHQPVPGMPGMNITPGRWSAGGGSDLRLAPHACWEVEYLEANQRTAGGCHPLSLTTIRWQFGHHQSGYC